MQGERAVLAGGGALPRNIPLFIAFRIFFNARWYYPVLGVLFLDLGLTLEQYALLNVAWALSIVCLEVPSGAIADQIGRRRMVVLAAGFMVVEMALFAFAPQGSAWLFPILLLNRILSGAAEASASGADESLAYDSLKEVGQSAAWPAVLARLMRWQSVAFFITMLGGSALYDAAFIQGALHTLGISADITSQTTLRWPLYATLLNSLVALFVASRLTEPQGSSLQRPSLGTTVHQTLAAGRWILLTPLVLVLILGGICVDSVIRLFLTFCSNYLRLIQLPEVSFGLVSAGLAVIGFFTPRLSQLLVVRQTMMANLLALAGMTLVGLFVAGMVWPLWGVLAILPLGVAMSMLQFFLSHYLNAAVTDSTLRATVLSFKGLAFNVGYGLAGLLFAGYSRFLMGHASESEALASALRVLPWVFAALTILIVAFAFRLLHRRTEA